MTIFPFFSTEHSIGFFEFKNLIYIFYFLSFIVYRYIPDALALKEVNNSLQADNGQEFKFAYDSEAGKYGYKVTDSEGADTFFPFSGDMELILFKSNSIQSASATLSENSTFGICTMGAYPAQWDLTINNTSFGTNSAFIYNTGGTSENFLFKNRYSANQGACGCVIFKITQKVH